MEKEPTKEAPVSPDQELMSPKDQIMNELAGGLSDSYYNGPKESLYPTIELPEHMPRTTVENNESDTEIVSSEEKQPNDDDASLEVAPESIDMNKRQPESVESELEKKFEGLWEAGDKVGAMGVALGRRVDSQEVMNDKMLGLALLSPNPKEAYGILLVHRAFSSKEPEKA